MSSLEQSVRVAVERGHIDGDVVVPEAARGVVLFAHGSGSSRHSSRNRFVAQQLTAAGLATLLIDLLTPEEERADMRTAHIRFDIPLLADRLGSAIDWLRENDATRDLYVGIFGAHGRWCCTRRCGETAGPDRRRRLTRRPPRPGR